MKRNIISNNPGKIRYQINTTEKFDYTINILDLILQVKKTHLPEGRQTNNVVSKKELSTYYNRSF